MKKRTLINSMQINTISRNSNQDFIRSAVKEFVKQIDLTITEMSDISTAVGEAIQNIIDFAYDNIGKIQVEVLIYEGNYIKIKIRDWGCGIDNVKQAMEPLYTTMDGDKAGLGFSVMESFMDSVKVYSNVGRGTTIVMQKTCCSKEF